MTRQPAVSALFLAMLLIAAAYASAFMPGGAPGWAPWALGLGTAASMVAITALGASRNGTIGRLALPFAFIFVVVAGGFGVALALPGTDAADAVLWLGLPPRAAVVLYVIGLAPLLVVPVAYALTFDEQTLRPEDVERIRRFREAREAAAGSATETRADRDGGE